MKLCDFGFTRYTVDDANKAVLSETFCGSLSYASPEILKGRAYDPKRSDMWAFGIMVFTMLNKAMPFDDAHATVKKLCILDFHKILSSLKSAAII